MDNSSERVPPNDSPAQYNNVGNDNGNYVGNDNGNYVSNDNDHTAENTGVSRKL